MVCGIVLISGCTLSPGNNKKDNNNNNNPPADTTRPEVISAVPAINSTDAPFDNRTITLTFSEDMADNQLGCSITYRIKGELGEILPIEFKTISNRTYACIYGEGLLPATTYEVSMHHDQAMVFKDKAGNPAKAQNWTFTTRDVKLEVVAQKVATAVGGNVYVDGVIKNADTFGYNNIHFDVDLYNAAQALVFRQEGCLELNTTFPILRPGMSMPFTIVIPDKDNIIKSAKVTVGKNSDLRMHWTNQVPYDKMATANDASHIGQDGYLVHGDVKNTGDKEANQYLVIGIFYDSSHQYIASSSAQQGNLGPGLTATFDIVVWNGYVNVSKISSYTLMVYVDS